MYILFVFSLAITTVLVSAQQQQATSGITSSSSDQHQLHLDETTQATTTTTSPASQHEQQSLFNNQSVQFGAEEKNDDEFRRTFDQQAATSIPLSQDKLDQQQQQQQQHQAATKETDPHSANRLSVTENFRLEFNKYKILSHLGITANPDELAPQLDEDLRTKLSATTAFTENSDPNKAVSRLLPNNNSQWISRGDCRPLAVLPVRARRDFFVSLFVYSPLASAMPTQINQLRWRSNFLFFSLSRPFGYISCLIVCVNG